MDILTGIISAFLNHPGVSVPIAVILLGVAAARWNYVRAIVRMAAAAYRIAEEEGILKNLKGAQKAAPFLEAFFAKWGDKHGTTPTPSAQALAMKVAAASAASDKSGK